MGLHMLFFLLGSIDQLSEIASVLGPPTKEELTEMNCQDLPITTLLITTTRYNDSCAY